MSETTYEQHQRVIGRAERTLEALRDALLAYANSAIEHQIGADAALKVIDMLENFGEEVEGVLLQARQNCQDIVAGKLNVSN